MSDITFRPPPGRTIVLARTEPDSWAGSWTTAVRKLIADLLQDGEPVPVSYRLFSGVRPGINSFLYTTQVKGIDSVGDLATTLGVSIDTDAIAEIWI